MIPHHIYRRLLLATAILNPAISSISGSVGRLVFYKRYGKTVMRTWINRLQYQ